MIDSVIDAFKGCETARLQQLYRACTSHGIPWQEDPSEDAIMIASYHHMQLRNLPESIAVKECEIVSHIRRHCLYEKALSH